MRGSIYKRVHNRKDGRQSINWYVVIELPRRLDGRRRQKWHGGYRTRREAEAVRAKLVHQHNTGTYTEPSSVTLTEWVHEHSLPTLAARVKPTTYDSYQRTLTPHVLPVFGSRQLRHLTPPMLNRLYADLLAGGHQRTGAGLAPASVRYVHVVIHKCLADCIDAGLLGVNVADRAKPPRVRGLVDELRFWEPAQLASFLSLVSGHRLEAAWRLAAMTGMRRGEVLGLRWKDVDWEASRISVRHTLVSVNYRVISSTPKAGRARVVDLDGQTMSLLAAHRQRQELEKEDWGELYEDADLVFCRENGTIVHPQRFSAMFRKIVAESDLPRIRLHDLRHTHATIAIKAGVPVKVISERLGHETPAFTLKQYAHVIPGMQAEAASVVAELVAAEDTTPVEDLVFRAMTRGRAYLPRSMHL